MKRLTSVEAYDTDVPKDVQFITAALDATKELYDALQEVVDDPASAYGVRQIAIVMEKKDYLMDIFVDGPFSHHMMRRLGESISVVDAYYYRVRDGNTTVGYHFGRQIEQCLRQVEARVEELEQIARWATGT